MPASLAPPSPEPVSPGPGAAGARRGVTPGVLHIPAFRRMWVALSLSSLGDWLGLLALTALAASLSQGSYAGANVAVAGVFLLRLAPAVVLGPLAGAMADRLDRRWTMVVCDLTRSALILSIAVVGELWWLYVATFLIECAALFWIPAKEATVPNIVPRRRLEQANQVNLLSTYGAAPVAAGLFALLTTAGGALSRINIDAVQVALVINSCTFLTAALVISRLTAIPARAGGPAMATPGVWSTIVEGWRYVGQTTVVRGLVIGMLGAFAAGGAVIGLARIHVADLGAGNPGYGVLFAAVFIGLASGMGVGPKVLGDFSRRRLFGLAIVAAGLSLSVLALMQDLVLATMVTYVLGCFAGLAWVSGYTLLGLEVADELRGRTFAFVQTMVRIVLVAVLAAAPLLAAAIGRHRVPLPDGGGVTYSGAAIVFAFAGVLAAVFGVSSYRQMDDRRGVPLGRDLWRALRSHPDDAGEDHTSHGFLLAFEGGEGSGKSTQSGLLAGWLLERGHEVVRTREPGGTPIGQRLRATLLDPATGALAPRAEALLYAADRAEHVHAVIRPGLAHGAVVITDRYVDSSVAYQGAGRVLPAEDVARLSRWATDGLVPDLTVVLDVPPEVGLTRRDEPADRLEREPIEFHDRVRERFLALAARHPQRYLVVNATLPQDEIAARVRERLEGALPPLSDPSVAEESPKESPDASPDAPVTGQGPARHGWAATAGRDAGDGTATGDGSGTGPDGALGDRPAPERADEALELVDDLRGPGNAERVAELDGGER